MGQVIGLAEVGHATVDRAAMAPFLPSVRLPAIPAVVGPGRAVDEGQRDVRPPPAEGMNGPVPLRTTVGLVVATVVVTRVGDGLVGRLARPVGATIPPVVLARPGVLAAILAGLLRLVARPDGPSTLVA